MTTARQEMHDAIARIANAKRPTSIGQTCVNSGVINGQEVIVTVKWAALRRVTTHYIVDGAKMNAETFYAHFGAPIYK